MLVCERGSRHGGGIETCIISSICHERYDILNNCSNIEAYRLKVKPEVKKKTFLDVLCSDQVKLILIIFLIILKLPMNCSMILSQLI